MEGMTRTVDDAMRDIAERARGSTQYAGREPSDAELMVAEIERVRAERRPISAAVVANHFRARMAAEREALTVAEFDVPAFPVSLVEENHDGFGVYLVGADGKRCVAANIYDPDTAAHLETLLNRVGAEVERLRAENARLIRDHVPTMGQMQDMADAVPAMLVDAWLTIDTLRGVAAFAREVFASRAFELSSYESLEAAAIQHGILVRVPRIAPCREDCRCAEFGVEGETPCLVVAPGIAAALENRIAAHQLDIGGPTREEETIERRISSVELLTAMMTQAGDAAGRDLWRDGALVQIRQLAATVEGFKR